MTQDAAPGLLPRFISEMELPEIACWPRPTPGAAYPYAPAPVADVPALVDRCAGTRL